MAICFSGTQRHEIDLNPEAMITQVRSIRITSSFVAEPIERSLRFLLDEAGIELEIEYSGFNQIFQEALDPASLSAQNDKGINVFLIRAEDIASGGRDMGLAEEFADALKTLSQCSSSRTLLIFCPGYEQTPEHDAREARVLSSLESEGRIVTVSSETLLSDYPVSDPFDSVADAASSIPFTEEMFSALGLSVARQISLAVRNQAKVIILDADNTLWGGVAGEDGPDGLSMDGPWGALRRMMSEKSEQGFLLALASKNNEADVDDVFAKRADDLLLCRDQFVGWKVNWKPKSENIQDLAGELNLGIDSFVFIDDNPAEVAEVAANCPGITAICLPAEAEEIPHFIDHLWCLDSSRRTAEDAIRTEFYQKEVARRKLQSASGDFASFLKELDLKVSIDQAEESDHARVSQLLLRTNQFNANSARLSEAEVAEQISVGAGCYTVTVSDRFGDYGMVGAILYGVSDTNLRTELFILSCRAMGKGVERKMIQFLGSVAQEKKCVSIEISFRDSEKNEPCRLFLDSIGAENDQVDGVYRIESEKAAGLALIPDHAAQGNKPGKAKVPTELISQWDSAFLSQMALEWSRPEKLNQFLHEDKKSRPDISEAYIKPGTELQKTIAGIWEDVLKIDGIGVADSFVGLGGGSLEMAMLHSKLQSVLKVEFELSELFTLPTVNAIAGAIESKASLEIKEKGTLSVLELRQREPDDLSDQVAIVGMSLRIPGADSPDELWSNLADGEESISFFKKEELAYPEEFDRPDFVPAKGIIKDIDMFDASFFGILPKDAKIMDPQQRIFLELAWEAMERAGYQPDNHSERIGVYAGAYFDTYLLANLCSDQKFLNDLIPQIQVGSLQTELGNDKDYLATRVAFKLNLKGPAMTLQTACSTSMVAIAEACRSIREGLCDMALAGGVTVTLPYKRGYFYTEQGMLSGDGHCRAFDEKASGTVFANGAGVVMLKRLSDAIRDRDHIHAVIRGTGMNNDGGIKHSYTAPSVDGQVDVIRMAHEDAGVTADTITAIEAHGTGTPMGDPIEVTALTKAFREAGVAGNQYCALGSLKTNVGHLDVASGVCGVIKTSLSLENRALPPMLHFQKANPKIDFENSPFFPNAELKSWEKLNEETPRRAGVSSFGVGGTNVHTVLEEAPEIVSEPSARDAQLIVVSARTEAALEQAGKNLAEFAAKQSGDEKLEDAAWTLGIGRKPFRVRRAVVAKDFGELHRNLTAEGIVGTVDRSDPPVNFMFPGQGSQHVNMARDFYRSEPRFRDLIDRCSELLEPHLYLKLTDVLFPDDGSDLEAAADLLQNTTLAQPSIFVIEYALADLWMHWGVTPKAIIGHSVGEFVAACHAGIFTLEEGLELLANRGRLMGELPGGGMLSVRLDEKSLLEKLPDTIDLAAVNSPGLCVVAGPHEELEKFTAELAKDDIVAKPLHTSHAFHSRMMDSVIPLFEACFEKVALKAPAIPIFSTVTGDWLKPEEAMSPRYWATHLRETVRFGDATAALGEIEEAQIFIEVGPGQTLCGLARQSVNREDRHRIVSTCLHVQEEGSDHAQMLKSLGRLWMDGVDVDWDSFYSAEIRKRVPLPTYPFERKRHWVDPVDTNVSTQEGSPLPVEPENFSNTNIALPEPDMSTPVVSRTDALASAIRGILTDLSGIPEEELVGGSTYLELGFDSLLLTQVSKALNDEFGTGVKMRELMTDLSSIDAMVVYLDGTLSKDQYREAVPVAAAAVQAAPEAQVQLSPATEQMQAVRATGATAMAPLALDGSVQSLIAQQMSLMQQQLNLLQGGVIPAEAQTQAGGVVTQQAVLPQETPAPAPAPAPAKASAEQNSPRKVSSAPTTKIDREVNETLTPLQQRHLDELIAKYTAKTSSSKALTEEYRQWYADPRTVSGFNRLWKEMIYQIVVEKSKGSRLRDIDGNEYIDMLNGFGPGFLGHSPDRITDVLHAQLDRGVEVGPQSQDAMEASKLFCELTGNERCSFVNTGSEAVQAAMRMTRTVTGRDKIVVFTKDYHGNFDEVLVRGIGSGDKLRSMPVAPGIPNRAVDDVIVLEYGTDEALEVIKARGNEIAAVIIEPIQSRRPEFQPREFIHEVRRITKETGSAFVFDEVITGFRTGPRGAQELFGVEADIATYGKVVGAGMPVGVVAGKAEYMDTFDGGQWEYGDDSFPEQGVTFFAGTFVRHPLAMAAVKEMLIYLNECGPELWTDLKAKADRLSSTVDRMFVDNDIPFRMPNFGSQMFVRHIDDNKYANLLFFHLREKGVFLLEGFPSYMTTSHTDEDIDYVIAAFRESIAEMQDAEFFPKPASGSVAKLNGKRLNGPERMLTAEDNSAISEEEGTSVKKKSFKEECCYPLTESLAEIWMASKQSDDASRCYNEVVELNFEGELDCEALTEAVQYAVNRHDGLRSVFLESGEGFKVVPELVIDIPIVDLSGISESDLQNQFEAQLDVEREHVFDLENGPLFRGRLVKRKENDHSLILNAHHLVCDGWSYNLVTGDIGDFYSARREGVSFTPAPASSLCNFALDAVRREEHGDTAESDRFWVASFDKPLPALDLPADRTFDSTERPLRGDRLTTTIESELLGRIREVARKSGATTFSLMMGAFQILLGRIGRQDRVVTFFPMSGQSLVEGFESMVGQCVNTLPLHSDLQADQPVADFLKEIQSSILDCMDYPECTFGRLLKLLPHSNRPTIDSIFNLEKMEGHVEFSGLTEKISEVRRRYMKEPIFLNAVERPDSIELQFNYQSGRFSEESVQTWVRTYVAILEKMVDSPAITLGEIRTAIDDTDLETLRQWSSQPAGKCSNDTVSRLFEEMVEAHASDTAISSSDVDLTYRELSEKVDAIACALVREGAESGDRIGVFLEQSPYRIASVLAVLKMGGTYVPLDPSYPKDRIAFMLDDSAARVVLTEESLVEVLKEVDTKHLFVDALVENGAGDNVSKLPEAKGGDNPAYVIYTSGSTGLPKGSVIPHRGIVRLVRNTNYCQFGPDETVLQAASICFDASTFEIFGALLNGGKLVLPPSGELTLATLSESIQGKGVTTLWLTSGLFQLMVEEDVSVFRGVRQLLTGGDVVPVSHAGMVKEAHPGITLINGYGPTENTTFTATYEITASDLEASSIPIGRPIANTSLWILDEEGRPLAPGVAGELCCGGDGLALEYLNRSELTAEKFIFADPAGKGKERLYRTGDLCRFRDDGVIEFLGRIDHQVKIRGFRVEPEEIESRLISNPLVGQCKVLAQGMSAGDKHLVAYVSPLNGHRPEPDALLSFLSSQLPSYMIPTKCMVLDELPLTVNGKIDTKALLVQSNLNEITPKSEVKGSVTETVLELKLATLWENVLKVPQVELGDSFFDLGGHSLLGMKLISRIQKEFGLQVPLSVLIKFPCLGELANELERRSETESNGVEAGGYQNLAEESATIDIAEAVAETTVVLQPKGDLPPLVGIHGGDGGVFFYQGLATRLGTERPFYAFEAAILTNGEEIKSELVETTAARYLAELKRIQKTGPYHLCGYSFGGVVAYEMACQLEEEGDEVGFLGLIDTWNPVAEGRRLSLSERIGSTWNDPEEQEVGAISKVTKISRQLGTGLGYRLKFSTQEAVAKSLPTSKSVGWLRKAQVNFAYSAAMDEYRPPRFTGDIALLKAVDEKNKCEEDGTYGWSDVVDGKISVFSIPGNHISVFNGGNLAKVSEAMRNAMTEATQ